jgi:hypothetical protein
MLLKQNVEEKEPEGEVLFHRNKRGKRVNITLGLKY